MAKFTTHFTTEILHDGKMSVQDFANFWGDMKHLLENSRKSHPITVARSFKQIEDAYHVPEKMSDAMGMYLIQKAAFEGCVHVARHLSEKWGCLLPLQSSDFRRVVISLEWSEDPEQNQLALEWSAERESWLLKARHADIATQSATALAL